MPATLLFRLLLSLMLLSPALTAAAALCPADHPDRLMNYDGDIGGRRIRLSLVVDHGRIGGLYFYGSQWRDIRLAGALAADGGLTLNEFDGAGRPAAQFQLHYAEHDPRGSFGDGKLTCEVLVGSWNLLSGRRTPVLVYLALSSTTTGSLAHRYAIAGVSDDAQIDQAVQLFWNAVRRNDRRAVAASVAYPVDANLAGSRQRIADEKGLLAVYDKIFTPAFRAAIGRTLPHNLFVNEQGIMLGDGAVWFNAAGRVQTFNN